MSALTPLAGSSVGVSSPPVDTPDSDGVGGRGGRRVVCPRWSPLGCGEGFFKVPDLRVSGLLLSGLDKHVQEAIAGVLLFPSSSPPLKAMLRVPMWEFADDEFLDVLVAHDGRSPFFDSFTQEAHAPLRAFFSTSVVFAFSATVRERSAELILERRSQRLHRLEQPIHRISTDTSLSAAALTGFFSGTGFCSHYRNLVRFLRFRALAAPPDSPPAPLPGLQAP